MGFLQLITFSGKDAFNMDKTTEKRYVPGSQILSYNNGAIHHGKDLFLNRSVMLYTRECQAGQSGEEYILGFSNRASFKHEGFHYILDTSFDEHSVLIVLQLKPGHLFLEEFKQKIWTFSQGITQVTELGISMLDAMEQQITGFSVGARNLWMGQDGRLSIINYWDEGEPQTQGAIGLCGLLIQIFSGSTTIPGPFEAQHMHLERIHIPSATAEQKDALIKLVKLVCQGQASLSTFVFGLRSLPLVNQTNIDKIPLVSPAKTDYSVGSMLSNQRTAAQDVENIPLEDANIEEKPNRLYKWVGVGVFALVFTVFLIWLLSYSPHPKEDVAVIPNESSKPTLESVPTNTPKPQQSQPTETPINQESNSGLNKEVTIPNLVGLTQSDAEKQARSSELHYNYILEANQPTKGIVFKQDPVSGTKVSKGDNITFWVSK
jgi:hypothetical protein